MIPKIIHYCWFGRNEKSEKIKFCMDSWKKYLPDYEIIEWNEDNFHINEIKYVNENYMVISTKEIAKKIGKSIWTVYDIAKKLNIGNYKWTENRIEILKNNEETIELVQKFNTHYISVISAMELYYGAFNKTELNKLKKFVELFHIININEEISDLSKKLVFDYAKSHSLDIPDSLIAATAIINNINLLSYNKKDFKFINNLKLL